MNRREITEPMATINISMPQEMKSWVEKQSDLGIHTNSSDYIRDLIIKDQRERGVFRKVPIEIFGATITVVGDFQPIAIGRDINLRGGKAERGLVPETKYVLAGKDLSDSDHQIIADAERLGIPCLSLEHYEAQLPDALEKMG